MIFFLLRVVAIYVVLLLPWPGVGTAYEAWFRGLGRIAALGGPWIVKVVAVPVEEKSVLTMRFLAGNSARRDADGNIVARGLDLDTWGVGWVPTALVIALIAATKLSWKRRLVALAWGLLLINFYIIFCLRIFLWNGTADLFDTGGLARSISGALSYTLITQMGAGFTSAVVIWILVTFRAEDLRISREGRKGR